MPSCRSTAALLLCLAACAGQPPVIVSDLLQPPKMELAELLPRVVGCWALQPGPWSNDPAELDRRRTSSAPKTFRLSDVRLDPAAPEFRRWGPVFAAKAFDGRPYETYRYWVQIDGRAKARVSSGDIGFALEVEPLDSATLKVMVFVTNDYGPPFEVSRRGTAQRIACERANLEPGA